MIALLLYLVVLSIGGAALMRRLHGGALARGPALLLDWSLGAGLVLGLSSLSLFVTGLVFDGLRPHAFWLELALLAALALAWVRVVGWRTILAGSAAPRDAGAAATLDERIGRAAVLVLGLAALALLIADLAVFVRLAGERPHGSWDAWGFWNLRARFFFGALHDWTSGALHHSQLHSDYPLLLPLTVTRFWVYLGDIPTHVPQLVGMASLLGLAGLLVGALAALRSVSHGLLAALALLSTGYLVELATWQYADLPLAFFVLASCALLCMADHPSFARERALTMAGAAAALAAWTKNEGILFLLVLFAARLSIAVATRGWRRAGRELVGMLLGALPVVAVLAGFKGAFGTPNDLLAGQNATETLHRLASWERYATIARALSEQARELVGLIPVFLLLIGAVNGPRTPKAMSPGAWTVALALAGLALGYFFVLVATPNPLEWHLQTAGRRLVLHIWPSLLFLYFMLVATTEEAVAGRQGDDPPGEGG